MRSYAADDFEIIRTHISQLAETAKPRCPVNPGRLLYDCLRSSTRCPEGCDFYGDWFGTGEGPVP